MVWPPCPCHWVASIITYGAAGRGEAKRDIREAIPRTQHVQDLCGQVGELAVLDKFAQMGEPTLLGIWDLLQLQDSSS